MAKTFLSPERAQNALKSVQFMALMAEMLSLEHCSELIDARFKEPKVNQFAGRIKQDCEAIKFHLKNNSKLNIKFNDAEFIEEYASALYRVFHFFIGLPVDQINELMDGYEKLAKEGEIKQAA